MRFRIIVLSSDILQISDFFNKKENFIRDFVKQ